MRMTWKHELNLAARGRNQSRRHRAMCWPAAAAATSRTQHAVAMQASWTQHRQGCALLQRVEARQKSTPTRNDGVVVNGTDFWWPLAPGRHVQTRSSQLLA